jgi:hypothetical protein
MGIEERVRERVEMGKVKPSGGWATPCVHSFATSPFSQGHGAPCPIPRHDGGVGDAVPDSPS